MLFTGRTPTVASEFVKLYLISPGIVQCGLAKLILSETRCARTQSPVEKHSRQTYFYPVNRLPGLPLRSTGDTHSESNYRVARLGSQKQQEEGNNDRHG